MIGERVIVYREQASLLQVRGASVGAAGRRSIARDKAR
ncbi:hypothetical protein C4K10_5836 [Pseudomonas chlororaphis subsp. aureofaciens]|nr:hypothetical protein C4K10_5836 [Pseudomonas chlororaphis subsp. aureofaciens]AZE20038.1 hypothetical protein C4K09_5622 [Pseudomonas chlororaphis subsp. aureofaciens]